MVDDSATAPGNAVAQLPNPRAERVRERRPPRARGATRARPRAASAPRPSPRPEREPEPEPAASDETPEVPRELPTRNQRGVSTARGCREGPSDATARGRHVVRPTHEYHSRRRVRRIAAIGVGSRSARGGPGARWTRARVAPRAPRRDRPPFTAATPRAPPLGAALALRRRRSVHGVRAERGARPGADALIIHRLPAPSSSSATGAAAEEAQRRDFRRRRGRRLPRAPGRPPVRHGQPREAAPV